MSDCSKKKIAHITLGLFVAILLGYTQASLVKLNSNINTLEAFTQQAFAKPLPLESFQKNSDFKNDTQLATQVVGETQPNTEPFSIINDVAFTTQSPFAEWDDPRQQDACEEASILMAINWAQGNTPLSQTESREILLRMSEFQEENFGAYKDTSTLDTYNWLVKGFFQYKEAWVQSDITVEDIIDELYSGHLVVIPTDGQKLKNPNFVGDGPPTHMILVTGYNPFTKKFTTNDPGTRNGKDFVYSKRNLAKSIRDYGTGYHAFQEALPTSMIVISK